MLNKHTQHRAKKLDDVEQTHDTERKNLSQVKDLGLKKCNYHM